MHDVLTSVMKSYISQVSLIAFKDFTEFFIPLIILQTFPRLENFNFKFTDFPNFPRICTKPCGRGAHYTSVGN